MSTVVQPADTPSFTALQQAAEWYARLQADTPAADERDDWQHWFDTSDEHRLAWGYVEQVARRFAPLQSADVAPVAEVALAGGIEGAGTSRRRSLQMLSLLALAGACGWGALRSGPATRQLLAWRADYATAIGEVKSLRLQDGSQLWLNTASALDVEFTAERRLLSLLDGELLLDTARDARPLVVESREGSMRALGTLFSVRQQSGFTDLAVYEGAVEVRNDAATRIIEAGEQVRFDQTVIQAPQPAQRARQLWSRGLLLADEIPLSELLAELGRYRHGHLGVAPEVADLRVMGTFPLRDPEQVFALLEQALPVRVRRTLPWWVTVEAL